MWGMEENYSFKVYFDSSLLHDSADMNDYYETEEEARMEAEEYIEGKIEDYKADGAWHEDDSEDDFDIVIDEHEADYEEDD